MYFLKDKKYSLTLNTGDWIRNPVTITLDPEQIIGYDGIKTALVFPPFKSISSLPVLTQSAHIH